ncbi:MAG: cell surface leucine-rich repeat-containing protein [bacterium P3]|nr:MAG: cell surface leucine-rich repeat-containing protein [bacterium P3]
MKKILLVLFMFASNMTLFAQSNIFDGITEAGIKLYQSREAEINEIGRLQPQLLEIPNDPNSISAKESMYRLERVLKYSLRIGDEQSSQLAKILIAKKYNAISLPTQNKQTIITPTPIEEFSAYPMQRTYNLKVSGIYYNYLSADERALEVTVSENGYSGSVNIPAKVTYQGNDYLVMAIGDSAFWSCRDLSSVTIPNTVTYIGKFAFENCSNLTSLTLRGSNVHIGTKAFNNCASLNTLAIPNDSPINVESFLSECGNTRGNYTIRRFQGTPPPTIANLNTQRETGSYNGTQFYKGNFKMVGFGYGANTDDVEGIATYYYRTATDGTRIFEGDFSFEAGHSNAYGRFKDNKQVGIWKWYHISPIDYRNEITEAIINFDENGVPNGRFDMWIGYGENQRRSWMSGVFENGKIVSVSYKDRSIITLEGRFNSKGSPIGKWNLTGKNVSNRNCVFIFDDYGNQKEAYYIDETTGDKVGVYSEYPKKVYGIVMSSILQHYFRSTPKKIY